MAGSTLTRLLVAQTQYVDLESNQTASGTKLIQILQTPNVPVVGNDVINKQYHDNLINYASGTKTLVNTLQIDLTANSNTTSGINTTLIGLNTYASGIETLRRAMISQSDHLDTRNITWTNLINTTVSGTTLTKTAGVDGNWDAGAVSTQTLSSGDGYAEYVIPSVTQHVMFGLSNGDSFGGYADIDFAIYTYAEGPIQVWEGGAFRGDVGVYVAGDVLRVAVEDGVVKYRKNGTLLYTSLVSPTYPLLVDTSLFNVGAYISGAVLGGLWSPSTKLDDLSTPDDNTDLDASTTVHGLAPKAVAPSSGLLSVLGIANAETVRTDKPLFDATLPEAVGTAAVGTAMAAARRDHVHAALPFVAVDGTLPTGANADVVASKLVYNKTCSDSDGDDVIDLHDGTVIGQIVTIYLGTKSGSDNAVITPVTKLGYSTITLDAANELATLQWQGATVGWAILYTSGGVA